MYHSFDTEIATFYGVNAAIILNNLAFWIKHNEANEKNFHEGTYWTYCSTKAFKELFPYLGDKQIYNALKKLEDEGLIRTGNYSENQYDRTKWYALTEKGKSILNKEEIEPSETEECIFQNGEMEYTERENGTAPKGESILNIYKLVSNTDSKPDNKTDKNNERARGNIGTRFATFWAAYPKKVGKGAAEKSFEKYKPDDSLLKTMLEAIEKAKQSRAWQENGGQFIPNPATWLNQRRWEDELTPQKPVYKQARDRPNDSLIGADGRPKWL